MNISYFGIDDDMGYVIHKMPCVNTSCTVSAWFEYDGNLIGAEKIDSLGRSYHVKEDGELWQEIQKRGKMYVK